MIGFVLRWERESAFERSTCARRQYCVDFVSFRGWFMRAGRLESERTYVRAGGQLGSGWADKRATDVGIPSFQIVGR